MTGILKFNLPEEREEFEMANKGATYALVLHEIDNWLRSKVKYAPEGADEKEIEAYEKTRDHLRNLAADYNVEI